MNHPDVGECGHISVPPAAYLHAAHVPPGVRLLQVVHGYREHLLDRIVNNAEFIPRGGRAALVRPSQTGAELPHAPLTPVFDVAGVLGLVIAGQREGLTLQDHQLASSGHMAVEVCRKGQNRIRGSAIPAYVFSRRGVTVDGQRDREGGTSRTCLQLTTGLDYHQIFLNGLKICTGFVTYNSDGILEAR